MTVNQQHILKTESPQGLFHGILMTVAWIGCQQLAIWSLLFRNRSRKAIYIHGGAMLILTFLIAISATQIILFKGTQVITKNWYHTILGLIISCCAPIVLAIGFMTRILQTSTKTHPNLLEKTKISHMISGWLLTAASRVALYNQWVTKQPIVFILLLIFDLIAHTAYFYMKLYQVRMENTSVPLQLFQKKSMVWMKEIKKQIDLQIYHGDYFIFADYIYRLTPLLTSHPGGFSIVNQIRGRQVDRFLLGVQPLEKFTDVFRVSHTVNSIRLAGSPIARLQRPRLYPNIQQLNDAKIETINLYQSSKRIYTVYLRQKDLSNKSFVYTGYSDLSQFGKYYAVTISDTKTRLYTMVNFLQSNNIKLVEHITQGGVFSVKQKLVLQQQGYNDQKYFQSINNWQLQLKPQEQFLTNTIPLLIKKYYDGQFTSVFLNEGFNGNIKISAPRGRGLGLQDLLNCPKPYKIIMFSGGTGIYPFADIIDIAFKQLLIQKQLLDDKQSAMRNLILNSDPILHTKPFKDFLFTLHISVPTIQQIHPITLFQCQFLSLHKKMKVYLKSHCHQDRNIIHERYPHIQINDTRYEKVVRQLNQEQISRIYICGPSRMTKGLVEQLQTLYWSPRRYFVL